MKETSHLPHLKRLEIELHQPEVRTDIERLDELLHESFLEFGKSGVSFTKAEILKLLLEESRPSRIWSEAYECSLLSDSIALLTYKAAHADDSGVLSKHSLRSSIWIETPRGWQVRFHQGTPTGAFRMRINVD